MPFLSNIERWGIQKELRRGRREGLTKGRKEGKEEALALGLECRFGLAALELRPRIEAIRSVERLRELIALLKAARRLQDFTAAPGRGARASRR